MHIPKEHLAQLRQRGLVVSSAFVQDHIAFPGGHTIGKPVAVAGNSVPGTSTIWAGTQTILDAPTVTLHAEGNVWYVTVREGVPLPASGDFVHEFDNPIDAINDILDYFFGDPLRMEPKVAAHQLMLKRLEDVDTPEGR